MLPGLTSHKRTIANWLVYSSLFYVGMITFQVIRGVGEMPDMPPSFGCIATDWL